MLLSFQVMKFLFTGLILAKIDDMKYKHLGKCSGHATPCMILKQIPKSIFLLYQKCLGADGSLGVLSVGF